MDHFPLPTKHHPNGHLNIPCIVNGDYDKGPFGGYPGRQGWKYPEFLPRDVLVATDILHHGEPSTVSELQPVLQNWLFFGTLHEIFGDHVALSDFVAIGDDGTKRLCTAALGTAVNGWIDQSADPTASNEVQKETIKQSCERVYQHLEVLYFAACGAREVADPKTLLAVSLLGDSLFSVIYGIYKGVLELETPIRQPWQRAFGHLLVPCFEERGWCPNVISRLTAGGDERFMTIYYCLNLWRPESQYSHEHETCTEDVCARTQIDPTTYKVSHVRSNCSCHMVGISAQQVRHILEEGKVPLLEVDPEQHTASLSLNVRRGSADDQFVAISHVWADGLGNIHDNAIPACSLQRIANLVNKLPSKKNAGDSPVPFWIDSICVPVGPPELKRLAMAYLREPYMSASNVLVLDQTIASISSEDLNILDIMAYLTCSNWIGRLWTLQEGRLGRRVWFQFQDKAVDLNVLLESWYDIPTSFRRPYRRDLFGSLVGTWNATMAFDDVRGQIIHNKTNLLRHMLKKRSVSVPSDEGLCLFTLAGMDLSVVAAMPGDGETRMTAFWDRVEEIPSGLLFSKSPKKLESAGYRWAPSSLMGKPYEHTDWSGDGFISQSMMGTSTPQGFVCRLSAFVMELDINRISISQYKSGFFFQSGKDWYEATKYEPWHQKPCGPPGPGKQKMALLLMEPIWTKLRKQKAEGTNWNSTTRALLAFIVNDTESPAKDRKQDAIHIRCWQHFLVKFDPIEQSINNAAWNAVTALSSETIQSDSFPYTATSLASHLVQSDSLFKQQCDVWAAGTNYASGEARFNARILELALPTDDFAGEAVALEDQLWCAD